MPSSGLQCYGGSNPGLAALLRRAPALGFVHVAPLTRGSELLVAPRGRPIIDCNHYHAAVAFAHSFLRGSGPGMNAVCHLKSREDHVGGTLHGIGNHIRLRSEGRNVPHEIGRARQCPLGRRNPSGRASLSIETRVRKRKKIKRNPVFEAPIEARSGGRYV